MKIGDRICTAARLGNKLRGGYPVWSGAIYEVRVRRHGRVSMGHSKTAFYRVGSFGRAASGRRPSGKLVAELEKQAKHPWLDGVRQNQSAD